MNSRTPWRDKLDRPAKIVAIRPKLQKRFGKGTMLIPSPLDVEAVIRKVPRGKVITSSQLGAKLAHAAGTNCTCPMTTGIFVRIIAEAAAESRITPYWRVVRDDGSFNEKFPGGPSIQAGRLKAEGHIIYQAGKIDRAGKLRVVLK